MAEHHAAPGEHFRQVTQGEPIAQAPEHHQPHLVGQILRPVQRGAGALVELLAAISATEPAIAVGRALGSLRHGGRTALPASHLDPLVDKGQAP